jgi:transposase
VRRLVRARLIGFKLAIARLDHTIRATIDPHPDAAGSFRRLTSVPGVGPVLAATLLALLPELGRISPKAVAALVGVAPSSRQSGNRDRGGRCRGGRSLVRSVLYMATLAAIRSGNPAIARFYDRLH